MSQGLNLSVRMDTYSALAEQALALFKSSRRAFYLIGFSVECDRVAVDKFSTFSRFRLPVDTYKAVIDDLFGLASTRYQPLELKQLVELNRVRVNCYDATRFGSHWALGNTA